ncbi:hypothetical protein Tco_0079474 [Tanacetum coccineum]
MLLSLKGKDHGKLLIDSILNEPFQYKTIVEGETENTPAMIRARTYTSLIDEEKLHESIDIKATNIVLQGLPQDIYNLVNHNDKSKQIWDRVKLLIQGSELSLQERESKLYDDFDMFCRIILTYVWNDSLRVLEREMWLDEHLERERKMTILA